MPDGRTYRRVESAPIIFPRVDAFSTNIGSIGNLRGPVWEVSLEDRVGCESHIDVLNGYYTGARGQCPSLTGSIRPFGRIKSSSKSCEPWVCPDRLPRNSDGVCICANPAAELIRERMKNYERRRRALQLETESGLRHGRHSTRLGNFDSDRTIDFESCMKLMKSQEPRTFLPSELRVGTGS
jgi:hypothetical protein